MALILAGCSGSAQKREEQRVAKQQIRKQLEDCRARGDHAACKAAGDAFASGERTGKPNLERAAAAYGDACALGHCDELRALATKSLADKNPGPALVGCATHDVETCKLACRAGELFGCEAACRSGDDPACVTVANAFANTNASLALAYLDIGCDKGAMGACEAVGDVMLSNKDYRRADVYLTMACEAGRQTACQSVKKVSMAGGHKRRKLDAVQWARANYEKAEKALGPFEGRLSSNDPCEEAYRRYEAVAKAGLVDITWKPAC